MMPGVQIRKWLQRIFAIYSMLVFAVLTIVTSGLVFLIRGLFKPSEAFPKAFQVIRTWMFLWSSFTGIYYKKYHLAPETTDGTYIYVSNHISFMDIPAQVMAINKPFRILGEVDYARIPIFGYIYKYMTISLKRTDLSSRVHSINNITNNLKSGMSVFIFPEGTFNETGNPLKEFYNGAFLIAIQTQTPIKPLIFLDNLERYQYSSLYNIKPGRCRILYLEPVEVKGLGLKDVSALKDKVYSIMDSVLRKHKTY